MHQRLGPILPMIMNQETPPRANAQALLTFVKIPADRIAVQAEAVGQGDCAADIDGVVRDRGDWTSQ